MKRAVEVSGDGSTTLRITDWDEPYHSRHGAIQESRHVFIEKGLKSCKARNLRILEMGFGTGLNALLTHLFARQNEMQVTYMGVEAFPLEEVEWSRMNYLEQLSVKDLETFWRAMHKVEADKWISITPDFMFQRAELDFQDFDSAPLFDLIYFDAFGPRVQPELWSAAIFDKMYNALVPGGRLVTYCSKGAVRRCMLQVGFEVEKVPGPPGKREMLRATK